MDLKKYFDRAKADSDEVTRLQNELDTQFNLGTDEGIQKAIDLQPMLEAAVNSAQASNKVYLSMRDAANLTGNAAALFVSNPEEDEEDETEGGKVKSLAEFNALTPKERLTFSQAGGRLVD
jgi:hypothetical protein